MFFDAPITAIMPVEEGLYVAADAVYWLAGRDPKKWVYTKVHEDTVPLGGWTIVPGDKLAGEDRPTGNHVVWVTRQGIMIGTPNGMVSKATGGVFHPPNPGVGVAVFRQREGMNHIVLSNKVN